jgi:serine/threonine protein kinase
MESHPVIHPSADALRAFALGKLDDSTASVLMSHLDSCPECCQAVAALSGDDFLGRLRQVHGHSATPAPARSLVEAAPKPPVNPSSLRNVPPELAHNPQYEVLRELGRGGMGVVYLAKNKLMDRLEVLKVVNKMLLDRPGAIERFLREIRSAAKLSHPNVVAAYSAVQSGDLLAFAMEYVEGDDLAKLVKSRGPLPVPHACYYVQQAALGLQHAHEKKMVHRDIKPQNLILSREGKKHIVKVLDFGLAKAKSEKAEETGLTGEGQMLGTPDYVAPEQTLDAAHADIRADIYSLGCTLYYLLTGAPPFEGLNLYGVLHAHLSMEAKPLNLVRPEVPERLAAVVRKMMAKDPAKRYQTPAEVVQALSVFGKSGTKGAPPKSSLERSVGAEPAGAKPAKPEPPVEPSAGVAKPKSPATEAAQPVASDTLTEGSITSVGVRKSGANRKRRQEVAQPSSKKRWLIGGGIGVGLLMFGLLGMWASGVFKVKTKDGTIVLENLPADAEVLVDGAKVWVSWGDGGKEAHISVKPGTHKIEATKDGIKVIGEEVEIDAGERRPLVVRLEPAPLPGQADPKGDQPQLPAKPQPHKSEGKVIPASAPVDPKLRRAYKTFSSDWMIDGEELLQNHMAGNACLVFGDFTWKDYDYSCEAKWVKGRTDFGLLYHVTGMGLSSFFAGSWNKTAFGVISVHQGHSTEQSRPSKLQKDSWHKLRVRLRGNHCQCYLDDQLVLEDEEKNNTQGAVGMRMTYAAVRFRNIRVTDPTGKVLFEGLPELPATASQWLPATEAASASELHCLHRHLAPVTTLTFSRDGRQVLSGSNDAYWLHTDEKATVGLTHRGRGTSIRLWDAEMGKELDHSPLVELSWTNSGFFKLALAPESPCFLAATNDGKVRLWGIEGDKLSPQLLFPEDTRGLNDLSFTPDGRRALGLSSTGGLWEWDFNEKKLLRQIPGALKGVTCAAIAPDGRRALLARKEQLFAEIDIDTGKETGRWKEAVGLVQCMVFSPDSRFVLTGGQDGTVRLWDVATGKQLYRLSSHRLPVRAVAFSPDGRRALSGSEDQTVRLWDLEGKKEQACFTGHTGTVQVVAFSPDGRRAASGGTDYTVRLWRLPPTKPEAPPGAGVKDDDKGFAPLFNGKDLTGWTVDGNDRQTWRVERGQIAVSGSGYRTRTWLLSEKDYADFVIRFEFQLGKGAVSTVALRALPGEIPGRDSRPWHFCIIIKEADTTPPERQPTGALLGKEDGSLVLPPRKPAKLKPEGSWNEMEIELRGQSLRISVNGQEIQDTSLEQLVAMGSILPGLKRSKGRIGFQKNVGDTGFRKIEIKELSTGKSETPKAAVPAVEENGFVPLFNGKDKTGWRAHPKQPGNWRVEKGILIGSGPAVSHLYSRRGDYKNFHLRVKARINDGGNSGLYFRTRFGPLLPPNNPVWPQGYEAQIYSTPLRGQQQTGSLHNIAKVTEQLHKPNEWFTLEVIAQGTHIVIKVNGKATVDYTDEKRLFTSGHIALQQLDASTVVEFRKIEIKELK